MGWTRLLDDVDGTDDVKKYMAKIQSFSNSITSRKPIGMVGIVDESQGEIIILILELAFWLAWGESVIYLTPSRYLVQHCVIICVKKRPTTNIQI